MRWYRQSPNTEYLAVIIRDRDSYEGPPAMEVPVLQLSPGVCTARGRGAAQPPPRTHNQSLHFSCSGRYPVSDDPQDSPSKPAVYRVLSYSEDEEIAFQPHSVAFNFLKL